MAQPTQDYVLVPRRTGVAVVDEPSLALQTIDYVRPETLVRRVQPPNLDEVSAALPPGTPVLTVYRDRVPVARVAVGSAVLTCGRHPDSDIFLDDMAVSRRHLRLESSAAGVSAYDVGSLNGTHVNGERIDSIRLHNGDEVHVGPFALVFQITEHAPQHARKHHSRTAPA